MNRHEFLAEIHARLKPRTYLEIGVSDGRSLALSRVPTIAVDPAFRVTSELRCDLHLVRATSDAFFKRRDPIRHLRSGRNPIRNLRRGRAAFGRYLGRNVVDLAFIDGMHLFEYALRDFMNVERYTGESSVIAIDDVFPRSIAEAARKRETSDWTGDVYKLLDVLSRYRPDLVLAPIDTMPTGVLIVMGTDPRSDVLAREYERLVADHVTPDPQDVPAHILRRTHAIDPTSFLDGPVLDWLRGHRARLVALERPGAALRAMRDRLQAAD